MGKPVSLKLGQYILLVVGLLSYGVAGGIFIAAVHWRIHGWAALSFPAQIPGTAAMAVLLIWRAMDSRQPGKPLYH
jgi:hypothetical protein